MHSDNPTLSAHLHRFVVPRMEFRLKLSLRTVGPGITICLIIALLLGCCPPENEVERIFGRLPKRNYDSIECSNLSVAREVLGLAAVDHTSSAADKLAYFSTLDPFIFSAGEYSFLVSDEAPLGFDPSDFSVTLVARTSSYSLTLVSGDFDGDTIRKRLSDNGYRSEDYRGREIYSLAWSDAPKKGGLFLAFANLTFIQDDIIVSAPTERILKDYLDWLEVGTMAEDQTIMGLVERLKGESSFYISRAVGTDELYGEDSLFIRSPEDWGLPGYRLSPYTYYSFGIRPAADKRRQRVTLLILYPDDASAENDVRSLTEGLERGKSLSRLVPFSDLLSVTQVTADGRVLTATIESQEDFDVKLLIRLNDLPFLVY